MKAVVSSAKPARKYNAGLSRREVQVLAEWERARQVSVRIEDLRRRFGPSTARDVARALVRKRVLERIQRGVYLVRPLRTLLRPTSTSSAALAGILLQGSEYYLGGLWAFTFHHLSSQQFASTLDAFVTRRLPARRLGQARIAFHRIKPGLLEYGIAQATVEGVEVHVGDLERTLLDALDHPRLVGGLRHGLALFLEGLDRADRGKLIQYACRGSRTGTCQRLGVLLERAGAPARALGPLRQKARQTRSLLSMLPDSPRVGRVNKRWGVVENDS